MAIPQTKFDIFLGFKQSVWLFSGLFRTIWPVIEIFIWKPWLVMRTYYILHQKVTAVLTKMCLEAIFLKLS